MRVWNDRSREEASLLNPAFCSTVLTFAVRGYAESNESGMPFALAFMVLPITLHLPTRRALPPNVRTSLARWLLNNADARVLLLERIQSLKPYSTEAVHFGLLAKWIGLGQGGRLVTTLQRSSLNRVTRTLGGEARECAMRAKFVGKWLAEGGSADTVMTLWGVRP